MPTAKWTASVKKQDLWTRTYVGWIHAGGRATMYVRKRGGRWTRSTDGEPAESRENQVLEFLLMRAIGKRVAELSGVWGEDGPSLLEEE